MTPLPINEISNTHRQTTYKFISSLECEGNQAGLWIKTAFNIRIFELHIEISSFYGAWELFQYATKFRSHAIT